jgi:hypothetical protein
LLIGIVYIEIKLPIHFNFYCIKITCSFFPKRYKALHHILYEYVEIVVAGLIKKTQHTKIYIFKELQCKCQKIYCFIKFLLLLKYGSSWNWSNDKVLVWCLIQIRYKLWFWPEQFYSCISCQYLQQKLPAIINYNNTSSSSNILLKLNNFSLQQKLFLKQYIFMKNEIIKRYVNI